MRSGTLGIILLLFMVLPHSCLGAGTNETLDAAGRITVTDVVVDPAVLMVGDVGLVTFTVENTGSSNVAVSDAQLISNEITVLNSELYQSTRTIGAGTRTKFSFTILANQPENIYYPAFYLNYKDAGSLRYNIPIRVEEPQLAISVAGIPEVFTKGVTNTITLLLGNAKSVNMTGITVIPSGEGIISNRTSAFIGDLPPHSEKSIVFELIPSVSTNLVFNVSYTCGMNAHQSSYSIPLRLGENKLAADPIVNNVEISSDSGGTQIAGDVSNAGLSDAYGVVVSLADSTQNDGNPNQKYAIGTISSGDFESFELVISQTSKQVPLVIQYKDSSGNQFSKNISLDITKISGGSAVGTSSEAGSGDAPAGGATPGASSGSTSRSSGRVNPMNPLSGMGNGLSKIPIIQILSGAALLIALFVLWRLWKRKGKGRKIRISFK
ncbi:MAG TPA: hypothetical protein VN372_08865 [Methanospirillum sp.]|nr:hypothetical protein [Methanospirillum sp.]